MFRVVSWPPFRCTTECGLRSRGDQRSRPITDTSPIIVLMGIFRRSLKITFRTPKSIHQHRATSSPAHTWKALWCTCIFPLLSFKKQAIWVYTKPLFGLLRHLDSRSENTFGVYFCPSEPCKIKKTARQKLTWKDCLGIVSIAGIPARKGPCGTKTLRVVNHYCDSNSLPR